MNSYEIEMNKCPEAALGYVFSERPHGIEVRDETGKTVVIAKGFSAARLYLLDVVIPKRTRVAG